MRNILICKSSKLPYFQSACNRFLDGNFVDVIVFHHQDVDKVEDYQDNGVVDCDIIPREENGDSNQIDNNEYGVSSDNPPINASVFSCYQVKTTLNNQRIEGCLLTNSRNPNIRNPKKDRINDDKAFCC